MRMRVCYQDCHERGLCCYVVIPITAITAVLLPFVTYVVFTDSPSYLIKLQAMKAHGGIMV
jgi:hypothetical protein